MADLSTPAFPQASGTRMQWEQMPVATRNAIEDRLGSEVVDARSQSGGFSPGLAVRLLLVDNNRVFLKAVCGSPNPDSPAMHRREARIAAALPAHVPAPALRWSMDDGEWVVLAFEDIDGRAPALPWRATELERVLAALHELATALTPSPIEVEPASEQLERMFGGWQRIADGAMPQTSLPAVVRDHVDELVEVESRWPEAVAGDSLVHLDLRADNLLLTADRVFVVDWPWATIAAPWIDLVAMLPSVAMQQGPDPEVVWRAHPLSRGVDDDHVDAFVAALAGMFLEASHRPPAPGIPTLRSFQATQGEQAAAWIARRRGWSRA
jgi:hypothetical protein